jgi:predicted nucleotidyltransferase
MTRSLDRRLLDTVTALIDGLEHANVRYCLIGALVPELLLKTPPPRRTNDADAVVQVETLEEFERVKSALELEPYGFTRTPGPFRVERGAGIDGGRTVPLVTIPLYVLLKIVAHSDRREARDPASVLHCLLWYEEDSERLYGVEHDGALIDFELAGAYLLGLDGRALVDPPLTTAIVPILKQLSDPESPLGFHTVREYRRGASNDRLRHRRRGCSVPTWTGSGSDTGSACHHERAVENHARN